MATFTCLNSGENAENIRFWRSVPKDVDPEYHEREPELVVGPGRPRTLTAKEENTIDIDVYPKVGLSKLQFYEKRRLFYYFSVNPRTPASRWRRLMKLKLKPKKKNSFKIIIGFFFSPHHYS